MPLPTVREGCCGCSLYTSSLVLSWLQVLFSGLGTLSFVATATVTKERILEELKKGEDYINDGSLDVIFAVGLVILTVHFLINAFLLYGVYKRNHCMMMPYLIITGATVVLHIIFSSLFFTTVFANPEVFMVAVCYGIFTAIFSYFWIILYSYFQEIKEEALINHNVFNKI